MICSEEKDRDDALSYIYMRWRLDLKRFLVAKNVKAIDTEDIVHNSIIALDNNIRNGRYERRSDCTLKSYFQKICKFQAMGDFRISKKTTLPGDEQSFDGKDERHPEVLMLEDDLKAMVDKVLNTLGKPCRELLLLVRMGYSMREIAFELGLENARKAIDKAYQCRQKLKKRIGRNPFIQNYLKGRNEK